jgi:hypothetical protein
VQKGLSANDSIGVAPAPRKRKAEEPVEPATKRSKGTEEDDEEEEEDEEEGDDEAPEDDADEQEQEEDEPAVSDVASK